MPSKFCWANFYLLTYSKYPEQSFGYLCFNHTMKKLLLGFLILTSACATATPTSAPIIFPTATNTLPATLVPVTSTPEPTLTAEPSPTPLPRFFTNEFDSSLAGWVILQAGSEATPNIKTENGTLLFQMDAPFTWLYALYGAEDYADVRIDTQYQNRAGTPSAVGLVCRYGDEQGWFEFNASSDGTYNLLYGKWLSTGIAEYTPITDGTSKDIQPSGATQTLGLECTANKIILYINDKLFRQVDVAHFELTAGKAGIIASSFQNTPIVIALDWVKISESTSP